MRLDQHLPARWASGLVITMVLGLTAAAQTPTPTPTPAAAPPSSDIFLIDVKTKKGELVFGDPQRITNTPGYNNQPSFMPDGKSVLYTSIRDKQADIYRYELGTGATSQVTDTPESEYSATLMPDKKNISVVRVEADGTQRLWKFSLDGGSSVLILENVKPVGYHHWIDDHTLALFILGGPGKPNFLEVLDATTGKSEFVTENPGRILRKVPNQNKFSFVHKVSDKNWEIKAFDLRARTSASLIATIPGAEDYAWLPDGKLLLAKDSKLFAVLPLSGSQWEEVADFSKSGIKRVTRIAVNSSGSRIAIVGLLDKK
jgi:WD40 repeat protein